MAAGFLANEIFERVNKRKSVALRIIRRLCLYSLYNLMVFDCLFPEIINPSPETSSIYSLCCPRYIKCMLCVCLFHFEVYVCLSVCIVTCSRAREKNEEEKTKIENRYEEGLLYILIYLSEKPAERVVAYFQEGQGYERCHHWRRS